MKHIINSLVLGLFSLHLIQAARVVYDMNITYVENVNPDNLKARQVVGVNGKWPPPPVEVTYGDTLVMNVHNALNEPTALHAHGQFQNGTAWMDGPVMVTQCAIPPNHDLQYEFNITQNGTYWIHAHYMGQYMDGLRFPMIIHNPQEPYTYEEEITVTVSDWYHDRSYDNLAKFLSVYNPTGAEPVPESALINDNANTTFTFVPGKTYRIRIINMSGFATFFYKIDGHQMDIIEVDGVYTQPKTVDSLYMTAAQRFSVLVKAKNTTDLNYYMHADMDTVMFDTVPEDLVSNITAPIYYDRNHQNFAASEDPNGMTETSFDDMSLVPLYAESAVEPDHHVNLTIDFQVTTDGINRGMFNELPYLAPKVPSLNTMLSMGADASNLDVYGPQSQAFMIKHLDMIEVVLNNLDANAHPFHFHGHTFQLVGRGEGVFDGNRSAVQWITNNPARRDTIRVDAGGYSIIRFRADNPGVWIFHCHIDWHLESGLAALFITAPEVAQQRMTLPQAFVDICEAGGTPGVGNAAGKMGLDLSGAPSGVTLIYDGFTAKGKGAMAACIISALVGMSAIAWYALNDPVRRIQESLNQ
ncbi:Cupredoxin [Gilbertella persicaria]|uniref:Cupredoxin n=1 Tax=Gilbertella persicaria TaxID=101096 RepID=UPI00221EE12E|nr:Cupredoxin [Gilbertella persicaria]KAI8062306.1 Cupredoxin [Gilbertella persicaria]